MKKEKVAQGRIVDPRGLVMGYVVDITGSGVNRKKMKKKKFGRINGTTEIGTTDQRNNASTDQGTTDEWSNKITVHLNKGKKRPM